MGVHRCILFAHAGKVLTFQVATSLRKNFVWRLFFVWLVLFFLFLVSRQYKKSILMYLCLYSVCIYYTSVRLSVSNKIITRALFFSLVNKFISACGIHCVLSYLWSLTFFVGRLSNVPPWMLPFLLLGEEERVDSLHTRPPYSLEKSYPAWSGFFASTDSWFILRYFSLLLLRQRNRYLFEYIIGV